MVQESKTQYSFPVGYHEFNKKAAFNYQLNRYYSMGQARLEDMEEVGKNVNKKTGLSFLMITNDRLLER